MPLRVEVDLQEIESVVYRCFAGMLREIEYPSHYLRKHFGLPDRNGEANELPASLQKAREWYGANGDPWMSAGLVAIRSIEGDLVTLANSSTLRSGLLAAGFCSAGVDRIVLAGISAGAAVDRQIRQMWEEEQPDQAMAFNAVAISVVEFLRDRGEEKLRELISAKLGMSCLPFYAPGYEGWPLEDQPVLFDLLENRGPLSILPSGFLQPQKSTLVAWGITPNGEIARGTDNFWNRMKTDRLSGQNGAPPGPGAGNYSFSERVLKKWATERLSIEKRNRGDLHARFRMTGSTCANMGLPLAIDYAIDLHPDESGDWIIESMDCRPAQRDTGHRLTCLYLKDTNLFWQAASERPPLAQAKLSGILDWKPAVSPAGCLCDRANRDHKWTAALQTLHYAVTNQLVPVE